MAKIPDDLLTEYRIFSTGKNVRPLATEYVKLIERIAALTTERDELKALATWTPINAARAAKEDDRG